MVDRTIMFLAQWAFLGKRESEHDASLSEFLWLVNVICCSSHFGLDIDPLVLELHLLASSLQQLSFRFYFIH